jgi:hypothetical protein
MLGDQDYREPSPGRRESDAEADATTADDYDVCHGH